MYREERTPNNNNKRKKYRIFFFIFHLNSNEAAPYTQEEMKIKFLFGFFLA
jgi:hypothetical protein